MFLFRCFSFSSFKMTLWFLWLVPEVAWFESGAAACKAWTPALWTSFLAGGFDFYTQISFEEGVCSAVPCPGVIWMQWQAVNLSQPSGNCNLFWFVTDRIPRMTPEEPDFTVVYFVLLRSQISSSPLLVWLHFGWDKNNCGGGLWALWWWLGAVTIHQFH